MTTLTTMRSTGAARRAPARDWDGVQFRALVLLCLPVHLMAAAAARLTPSFWSGSRIRAPLFAEAWQASGTTARIAFAG